MLKESKRIFEDVRRILKNLQDIKRIFRISKESSRYQKNLQESQTSSKNRRHRSMLHPEIQYTLKHTTRTHTKQKRIDTEGMVENLNASQRIAIESLGIRNPGSVSSDGRKNPGENPWKNLGKNAGVVSFDWRM